MADENTQNNGEQQQVRVEFTPEQQDAINKIINERFGKVQQKHQKDLEAKQAELDAAKQAADEARQALEAKNGNKENKDGDNKQAEEAAKDQYKELLDNEKNKVRLAEQRAQQAQEEAKKAKDEALLVKKRQAMYSAMSGKNFYQIDDVLNLTDKNVVFDAESGEFVVKEGGVIRQNSSLQNMSLDEYYMDFAAKRPYLVNGDVKSGTGSRESSGASSAGLITKKSDFKTPKEKSDFITKFGYEKFVELPQ